jgi:membrane protease YdiL (CAAX protease family)
VLTDKAWRSEAILRLFLSVVVCGFLGALAIAAVKAARFDLFDKRVTFILLASGAAGFAIGALVVLRKPWELARFTRSFAVLLICIYVSLTLGAFAFGITAKFTGGNDVLLMTIRVLSFQGATLVLIQRFLRDHGTNWTEGFGLSRNAGMAVLYGFLVASTFLPIGWLVQMGSFKALTFLNQTPEIQPAVQALKESVVWYDHAMLALVAILMAPLAEEMLFRGILYPAIKQAGYPKLGLWITSVAFAAVHGHLPSFLSLLLLALMLVWIYEYTQNLLAPIIAHACFNAFNFISGIFGEQLNAAFQQLFNRSTGP